jgi:hypothetical protein
MHHRGDWPSESANSSARRLGSVTANYVRWMSGGAGRVRSLYGSEWPASADVGEPRGCVPSTCKYQFNLAVPT